MPDATKTVVMYCVKCRSKKVVIDPVEVSMENKRQALKGKCPDCGTTTFKIIGKS